MMERTKVKSDRNDFIEYLLEQCGFSPLVWELQDRLVDDSGIEHDVDNLMYSSLYKEQKEEYENWRHDNGRK